MTERREHDAAFTPLSMAEVRDELSLAFEALTGRPPTAAELANLAAQVHLETAGGQKMRGHNFGNLTGDYRGHFFPLSAPEHIHGEWKNVEQPYRWYPSPESGALDYLEMLQDRYPTAWRSLGKNPERFAAALKHGEPYQYFTAPIDTYAAGLRDRYRGPVSAPTDASWLPLAVTLAAFAFVGYRLWGDK
ncbi:MAG: hypothetical protein ACOCUS_05435 [Polyangiales bacterium]